MTRRTPSARLASVEARRPRVRLEGSALDALADRVADRILPHLDALLRATLGPGNPAAEEGTSTWPETRSASMDPTSTDGDGRSSSSMGPADSPCRLPDSRAVVDGWGAKNETYRMTLSQTPIAIYLRAWREDHRRRDLCSQCNAPAAPGACRCPRHLETMRLARKAKP